MLAKDLIDMFLEHYELPIATLSVIDNTTIQLDYKNKVQLKLYLNSSNKAQNNEGLVYRAPYLLTDLNVYAQQICYRTCDEPDKTYAIIAENTYIQATKVNIDIMGSVDFVEEYAIISCFAALITMALIYHREDVDLYKTHMTSEGSEDILLKAKCKKRLLLTANELLNILTANYNVPFANFYVRDPNAIEISCGNILMANLYLGSYRGYGEPLDYGYSAETLNDKVEIKARDILKGIAEDKECLFALGKPFTCLEIQECTTDKYSRTDICKYALPVVTAALLLTALYVGVNVDLRRTYALGNITFLSPK